MVHQAEEDDGGDQDHVGEPDDPQVAETVREHPADEVADDAERAEAGQSRGPGSFAPAFLDALYALEELV